MRSPRRFIIGGSHNVMSSLRRSTWVILLKRSLRAIPSNPSAYVIQDRFYDKRPPFSLRFRLVRWRSGFSWSRGNRRSLGTSQYLQSTMSQEQLVGSATMTVARVFLQNIEIEKKFYG
ncbi:hypothetical protein AVEN_234789-1 [Araneus ventricosus]|uniref:Uncharacterized protein n=1 Tax=Araneus ventricosus TaxID=182803 RepID=A0A4Y2F714_ARAVE|nr:hypothetical protein AVEN_234789-1 [Araneus ventricosus]